VLDRDGFADNRAALVDPLLGVIYALLAFAVLIAALGIMNTLALSIMERTRELGVLRAIGATRTQVRTIVRWESVMIAWFGTTVGLVIGTGFGWAVVRALDSEGITNLVVPTTTLAVVAALAAGAGVAAAVVPCPPSGTPRRARRTAVVMSRSLGGVTEADVAPKHAAFGPLAYLRSLPVLVQDGGTVAVLLLVQFVALASSGADRVESDLTRPSTPGRTA
jgi:predicted lysophospholipase L1 biosynthesis ABC-type transport system permease subunit